MDDYAEDAPAEDAVDAEAAPSDESERALVEKLFKRIKADKEHHSKAFERMREDMTLARLGRSKDWPERNYTANITGRYIAQKVATLYAKNPKAIARRRETLDFAVWDETPESVMLAFQTIQQAQTMASAPPMVDPMTGMPMQPEMPPGYEEALALMADFQQGMQRRQQIKRMGKTMEILFAHALREQAPLDFKSAAKRMVKRAATTGVGYVEVQFQRAMGADPTISARLVDAQARIAHLQDMSADMLEDGDDLSAEMLELQTAIAALQAEPQIVVKEGLVFDYPASTRVIPDKLCTSLVGFVGARHLSVEIPMTRDQVENTFNVSLKEARSSRYSTSDNAEQGDTFEKPGEDRMCVYKHFDKVTGLVYYLCDGYPKMLRPGAPPDVKVDNFFPLLAVTFNDVEDEKELFPPSDVRLIKSMQDEWNRSRQGKTDHRVFARPRMAAAKGVLDQESQDALASLEAFSVALLNLPPGAKVADVLQAIQVPGVDPNLYDVNEIMSDMQVVVGAQQAQLGGVSNSTATEAGIAANSTATASGSNIDDMDGFLTRLARMSGQVLLREMTPEYVQKVVGPGALWPTLDDQTIAEELFLEVEAGSTGKPNQAMEIANWERLLPSLLQMPSINPLWLAKETLRRLDDRMDLTEAIAAQFPAIVAQNRMAQPMTDPANDPNQQGQEGGDKNATPQGQDGSQAPMGNNQGAPPGEVLPGAGPPV